MEFFGQQLKIFSTVDLKNKQRARHLFVQFIFLDFCAPNSSEQGINILK